MLSEGIQGIDNMFTILDGMSLPLPLAYKEPF